MTLSIRPIGLTYSPLQANSIVFFLNAQRVLFVEFAKIILMWAVLFLKIKAFIVYHFALICLHIGRKS